MSFLSYSSLPGVWLYISEVNLSCISFAIESYWEKVREEETEEHLSELYHQ